MTAAGVTGARTAAASAGRDADFGPWQPGVVSPVPARLRHLATAVTPQNVLTPFREAIELADLTGLPPHEVVAFRPERLVLHELLVRVTADFSVPDGPRIEDLGINMREITRILLARHIAPHMPALVAAYESVRSQVAAVVSRELATLEAVGAQTSAPAVATRARFAWLRRRAAPEPADDPAAREARTVAQWRERARSSADEVEHAALRALAKAGGALLVRHGRLWADPSVIARLATGIACNEAAAEVLGRHLEPLLAQAVALERFRLLPAQDEPVVMNTKGPSAAGKSTIRPLQRSLAGRVGVSWGDFALISPDIWRKQLLDYASLGPDYKYGASLTGDELGIIDHKLDRYMARKAARGDMPHLLIDRFRFESFAPESDEAGSNLLTRFGERIYLFFLVTPPPSLVERAWQRGLEVGRYKSVDDVLAHAVEAYSGFAELFFTWVERADKRVHFEFLDNAVPQGERPRTAAFGWNDVMNVLDVRRLLDVERFRRIDVDAASPSRLYPDRAALAPGRNVGFLARCVARFAQVNFAVPETGEIYLEVRFGAVAWCNPALLAQQRTADEMREALDTLVPDAFAPASAPASLPGHAAPSAPVSDGDTTRTLSPAEREHTVGRWGPPLAQT